MRGHDSQWTINNGRRPPLSPIVHCARARARQCIAICHPSSIARPAYRMVNGQWIASIAHCPLRDANELWTMGAGSRSPRPCEIARVTPVVRPAALSLPMPLLRDAVVAHLACRLARHSDSWSRVPSPRNDEPFVIAHGSRASCRPGCQKAEVV